MTILHTDDIAVQKYTVQAVTERDAANTGIVGAVVEKAKPVIHTITRTYDLPGGGLYRMYQLNGAKDALAFDVAEAWLLESKIIVAWYLFVPVVEAG